MSAAKKPRLSSSGNERANGKASIYIIPNGIQKQRYNIFKTKSEECGMFVADHFGHNVTHVVTTAASIEAVKKILKTGEEFHPSSGIEVVKDVWLSKCLEKKYIVPVTEDYRVKKTQVEDAPPPKNDNMDYKKMSKWTFSSPTPLNHHNKRLTDALEVLERHAEFSIKDDTEDTRKEYIRALAFRRCASTLKALPFSVQTAAQVKDLPYVGDHAFRVIKDILEDGFSDEVDNIINDEWYRKMKIFTAVFGVGATTAKKWIAMGLNTIEEAQQSKEVFDHTVDSQRLSIGLAYYKDLNLLVKRSEADAFADFIRSTVQVILPGTTVDLTGGFRRGKETGHDIDLLISHPVEGCEVGLLPKLIEHLKKLNIIIYGRYEKCSYRPAVLSTSSIKGEYLKSTLDYFEKWIGVVKIAKELQDPVKDGESLVYDPEVFNTETVLPPVPSMDSVDTADYKTLKKSASLLKATSVSESERPWLARRVDLIITPASQYAFALVGWTGSRHFNRELRRYADNNNRKLSSHGLYDFSKNKSLEAKTEEDVFNLMGVPCQKPSDRNA